MLLDAFFAPVVGDDVGRTQQIHDQQQAVLDAFDAGEFDLEHRPETVAALTGRITASGFA